MANQIQIRRSTGTSRANASLADGELAHLQGTGGPSNDGGRLLIGTPSNGVAEIGGEYFTNFLDHVPGVTTASHALVTDGTSAVSVLKTGTNASAAGTLHFYEGTNNGTKALILQGAADVGPADLTLTLPTATDTLVGKATTDVFTNKSYDLGGTGNVLTGSLAEFNTALQSKTFCTLEDAETISGVKNFTGVPNIPEIDSGAAITLDATTAINLNSDTGVISLQDDSTTFGSLNNNSGNLIIKSGSTTAATFTAQHLALAGNITSVGTVTSTGDITSGGEFVIGSSNVDETELGILEGAIVTTAELNKVADVTAGTVTASKAIVVDGSKDIATLGTVTLASVKTATLDVTNATLSTDASNRDIVLSPHGTGEIDVSDSIITGLKEPTGATHAVTKAYVDAVKTGLTIKDSVSVATTVDVTDWTYANGTAGVGATLTASGNGAVSLDGVALTLNMRVLVKNQAPATENGIYYVSTAGAVGAILVLTRATDADQPAEFGGGSFTFVEQGTAGAENGYVFTHNGTPTFGAGNTDLTVSQFSGAGQVIAGAGLVKSGNTVDAVGTANRITVNADTIDIHASYAGQNTIATVGTVTAGRWQSTTEDIGVAYGGTGVGTFTSNGILFGNGTGALQVTAAGADTYFLKSNSGTPEWSNVIDGGTF